jgi:hypothetical protein
MCTVLSRRRAVLLFVWLPLAVLPLCGGAVCSLGGGNAVVPEPPDVVVEQPGTVVVAAGAFGIDLVNETDFEVDPGVSVDEFVLDLGTVGPLEGSDLPVSFDVDCVPGDTLTIDPALFLSPVTSVFATNAPIVLHEGADYFCGDVITLDFVQDANGTFFVDVAVNGVFIPF